jgi:hypothetical protein
LVFEVGGGGAVHQMRFVIVSTDVISWKFCE